MNDVASLLKPQKQFRDVSIVVETADVAARSLRSASRKCS